MRFACGVGARFRSFSLIARSADDPAEAPLALPKGPHLVPLPGYPSLRAIGRVIAALPATLRGLWRAVADVDVIWASGVHPFGLVIALFARLRGRRTVLLIRQDSPSYFRSRLPSRAWAPLLLPLKLLDLSFRILSRRLPTTVVGADLAERYGRSERLLEMHVTLLGRDQLAAAASNADWSGRIRLLTVGRIEPEKNPLLLIEVLAALEREQPGRFSLTWIGDGRMLEPLRAAAAEGGLDASLATPGFIPYGDDLLRHYRDSHAFVHVALTEGVPQVLYEAMGSGLPIAATDVGGIASALAGGERGLLVPPSDPGAMRSAIQRLEAEPELRARLAGAALDYARQLTIETESERVAGFISGGSS